MIRTVFDRIVDKVFKDSDKNIAINSNYPPLVNDLQSIGVDEEQSGSFVNQFDGITLFG